MFLNLGRGVARRPIRHASSEAGYYTSYPQWVSLPPPPPGQQVIQPIGTFSFYLFNQGRAPAREVHVGHCSFLPHNNVYPDIPREVIPTPGGGQAIRFPVIPPKILITISYLVFGNFTVEGMISYVGSEEGAAQRVPVVLQRVWPGWWMKLGYLIFFLGSWVLLNATFSLIRFLWITFYK
jgi:hypothetical protein